MFPKSFFVLILRSFCAMWLEEFRVRQIFKVGRLINRFVLIALSSSCDPICSTNRETKKREKARTSKNGSH